MYTENENLYEDEDYEEVSNWDNNRGLIFKIIIIILCIIVLIWLIKALKNNRNLSDNSETHVANVEKVRLAAENYFFIKNNKDNTSTVSLATLNNAGLIGDVVDANNKVCNQNNSKVNLDKDVDTYKMTVSLSCSTKDNEEVFYYHRNTLACLNCNGKTYMDGQEVIVAQADDNGGNNNVSDDIRDDNDEYKYYSCINWSDWTKDRVYDNSLTERSKTLVLGVKYGTKTVYGEWSEYTTTPIVGSDSIEIETKTITENVWSENKTGRNIDTSNPNIKVLSTDTVSGSSKKCKEGILKDDACYSEKEKVGNLKYKQFYSGNYNIKNGYCEDIDTLQNKEGLYVLTYINCVYTEKVGTPTKGSSSYTVYTYQEVEKKDVTYYRYRTIMTVNEPDQYTDKKYETGGSGFPGSDNSDGIWSFVYSLPDTWYCVDTDFDLDGYLDIYDGCTFDEPFWKKEGYLAVNFLIEAYTEDGTVIMSYSNLKANVEAGMCDMWAKEKFITEKTDVYGMAFSLDEGDVIVVRLPGSTIKKGSGVPDPPTNLKEDNMIRSGGGPYLSLPR